MTIITHKLLCNRRFIWKLAGTKPMIWIIAYITHNQLWIITFVILWFTILALALLSLKKVLYHTLLFSTIFDRWWLLWRIFRRLALWRFFIINSSVLYILVPSQRASLFDIKISGIRCLGIVNERSSKLCSGPLFCSLHFWILIFNWLNV